MFGARRGRLVVGICVLCLVSACGTSTAGTAIPAPRPTVQYAGRAAAQLRFRPVIEEIAAKTTIQTTVTDDCWNAPSGLIGTQPADGSQEATHCAALRQPTDSDAQNAAV